jgi:glycosyltransferase involved in cell wall biosynthesis
VNPVTAWLVSSSPSIATETLGSPARDDERLKWSLLTRENAQTFSCTLGFYASSLPRKNLLSPRHVQVTNDRYAMKKRILVLIDHYLPGYQAGGPVRSIANMIDALASDYKWLVFTRDRDISDTQPYDGVAVGVWLRTGLVRIFYAGPHHLSLFSILREIQHAKPDVLYLNSFFSARFSIWPVLASRLGLLPDTRILLAPRGEFSMGALSIKRIRKALLLALSRTCGMHSRVSWHASSELEAEDIRRALGSLICTIHVARNIGVPYSGHSLACAAAADQGALPMLPLRLTFLSRISRKKNLDYALRVLAMVSVPVRFTIYGPMEDPKYWAECQEAATVLPDHISVEWYGPVPHQEVIGKLSEHEVLFLPTRGENYGHVMAEALSAGLALLISDQTPWRNLAKLGIGSDLPLANPVAFARTIDALANETRGQRDARRTKCIDFARQTLQEGAPAQSTRMMFARVLGHDEPTR